MICNLGVVGSNPTRGSTNLTTAETARRFTGKGEYQSGQMGQTVNLLVFTFGGSNPSSPTLYGVITCASGKIAVVAQLIEHQPSKLRVASLSLVFRSTTYCQCSSGVEHFLGKEEVAGSNPAIGSTKRLTAPIALCAIEPLL